LAAPRLFPTNGAWRLIEEAVLLADRIMVLSSNPGRIEAELTVAQPRPRDRRSPEFEALVDQVYGILTGRDEAEEHEQEQATAPETNGTKRKAPKSPTEAPLPDLREGFFLDLLRRGFSAEEARRQLDTAIDWGRYAELFDYDADDGMLLLEREPGDIR